MWREPTYGRGLWAPPPSRCSLFLHETCRLGSVGGKSSAGLRNSDHGDTDFQNEVLPATPSDDEDAAVELRAVEKID
jgi:hypothetical protein